MKKVWLFIKKWWFGLLLIFAGIYFKRAMDKHNGKSADLEDRRTEDLIKKINKTEREIKKIKKVKKDAFNNHSRSDNVSGIRRLLKRINGH